MKKKNRLQLVLAFTMVMFGIALVSLAFFMPPMGQIDATVLTAYGETLTFAGSLIGLDYHYRCKTPRPPLGGGELGNKTPRPPLGGGE